MNHAYFHPCVLSPPLELIFVGVCRWEMLQCLVFNQKRSMCGFLCRSFFAPSGCWLRCLHGFSWLQTFARWFSLLERKEVRILEWLLRWKRGLRTLVDPGGRVGWNELTKPHRAFIKLIDVYRYCFILNFDKMWNKLSTHSLLSVKKLTQNAFQAILEPIFSLQL